MISSFCGREKNVSFYEEVIYMDNNIKRLIRIETNTEEEMLTIKSRIHDQLVGNKDYIDCNIVLNGSDDRLENGYEIHLYIFEECTYIPSIAIY